MKPDDLEQIKLAQTHLKKVCDRYKCNIDCDNCPMNYGPEAAPCPYLFLSHIIRYSEDDHTQQTLTLEY